VLENKPKLILGGAAQKERKNEKGHFEAQKKCWEVWLLAGNGFSSLPDESKNF
jgi:hypothetical protein